MPHPPTPLPVSIVIPVYRDTPALAALLTRLERDSPGCERLAVDASADPACRALCEAHGATWLPSRPCRGAQLNQGAARASGAVLWFLHADAAPAPDALAALRACIGRGAEGGAFRFSLPEAQGPMPRLIEWGTALRVRCGGMLYGDQGLFVTREAFAACGGFGEGGLFEEVPLVRALRRRGRFVPLALPIGVSPRRWQRDGWLRGILRNRLLALAHLAGVRSETLARWYRRPRRHRSTPE